MADFFGTPGTTTIHQAPGTAAAKPPGFSFAKWLFEQLPGLMNTPFPTYQGKLDPGMSPTMQDAIRRAQGYAASSPPEVLAGVQGALGRYMNPTYRNPWHALFNGQSNQGTTGAAGPSGPGVPGVGGPTANNPWAVGGAPEIFGGAPNYFQVKPAQRVYGGGPAGGMAWNLPPPPRPDVPVPAPPPGGWGGGGG
jgi:hypothetical protein